MSFKPAQECVIRVLKNRDLDKNLIILVSPEDINDVLTLVSVTIGQDVSCHGGIWQLSDGIYVCVRRFTDKVFSLEKDSVVEVCNGGRTLSPKENARIEAWKDDC